MSDVNVRREISIGTIVATIGLVVSLMGVGATLIQIGVWRGVMDAEINALKLQMGQVQADSRALVRLQSDIDYLRKAVDEIRGK